MRAGRGERRLARLVRGRHRSAARVRRAVPAERAAPEAGEAGEQGLGAGGAPRTVPRVSDPRRRDEAARLPVGRRRREGGDDPVVFGQFTLWGSDGPVRSTVAADISGAESGSVVLASANKYVSYSTDAGSTFTSLNPTTIFDNTADGGFCCDQIIQYVPSIDRFIWLMQFSTGANGKNRLRIAAASPESIVSSNCTSWTYWDLTTDGLGVTTTAADATAGNHWLDYPNMSVGDELALHQRRQRGQRGRFASDGRAHRRPRAVERDPIGEHDQLPLYALGRRRAGLRVARDAEHGGRGVLGRLEEQQHPAGLQLARELDVLFMARRGREQLAQRNAQLDRRRTATTGSPRRRASRTPA